MLNQVLLIVHVMAAMLWFGGAAFAPRQLREALAMPREQARELTAGVLSRGGVLGISATLVLLTGVGLALIRGFGNLHPRFHTALLLTLIWWALGLFVVRPAVKKIVDIVAGDGDLAPTQALAKRVGMMSGIMHALFTVTVVLMLWRL